MNKAGNIVLLVVASAVAWAAYFGYKAYKDRTPDSPIAQETEQERQESIEAAYGDPAEVDDAEVEQFVTGLMKAVVEHDSTTLGGMVSTDRLIDGVSASSGVKIPMLARGMIDKELRAGMLDFFDDTAVQTQIKRIDRDDQGNIVVYIRQIDHERISVKLRWWLVRQDGALRWWDGEDLQVGLRVSTLMAMGIAAAEEGDNGKFLRFANMIAGLAELDVSDPDAVRAFDEQLAAIDSSDLPTDFRNLHLIARATMATALSEPERALTFLDTLDENARGPSDMPIRHFQRAACDSALERWEDAAENAQVFLDVLGHDAEAYSTLGFARFQLDRTEEAIAAFDAGVADDPGLVDNYVGLAIVLDTPDLTERLRPIEDTALLDQLRAELSTPDTEAELQRVMDATKTTHPDWHAAQ